MDNNPCDTAPGAEGLGASPPQVVIKKEPRKKPDPMRAPTQRAQTSVESGRRGPTSRGNTAPPALVEGAYNASAAKNAAPAAIHREDADVKPKLEPDVYTDASPMEPETLDLTNLKKLTSEDSLDTLETAVQRGLQLLDSLTAPLDDTKDGEMVPKWLEAVEKLRGLAERTRTIVAVVGGTGAGKSSTINALLDVERLLPTNGVRACTAVPSEVSYNDSNDPEQLFRAEVEFVYAFPGVLFPSVAIQELKDECPVPGPPPLTLTPSGWGNDWMLTLCSSADDWTRDVTRSMANLIDSNQVLSADYLNADAEAGIAYAKLKAVFPQKTRTKEMVAKSKPEDFINDPEVVRVLGTIKKIAAPDCRRLYSELQQYMDSKDKPAAKGPTAGKKKGMAFWPLIKVVKVFVKSDALSTGVVLVDLPGVHDANAARSAVADRYMAHCTAIWVVSPIMRAVDDKAAKDLLGAAFKVQLRLDGTYSNVTFICSKTDDISANEVAETLEVEEVLEEIRGREAAIDRELQEATQALPQVEENVKHLEEKLEDIHDSISAWLRLEKKAARVGSVNLPRRLLAKRKRAVQATTPRKKRGAPQEVISDESSSEEEDEKADMAQIQAQLSMLRDEEPAVAAELQKARQRAIDAHTQISELKAEKDLMSNEKVVVCVQARNDYSKPAIRQDFAAGIYEMDQEAAAEDAEEALAPENEPRDYERFAQSLPVFCTSSRAYQQFRGRGDEGDPIKGYRNIEETEIPHLQAHAKTLTRADRITAMTRFLNELSRVISSMMIWVTSPEAKVGVPVESEQSYEIRHLEVAAAGLKTDLDKAAASARSILEESMKTNIFSRHQSAVHLAANRAIKAATSWSLPKAERGIQFSTYRAICRNDGHKTKSKVSRDFNEELDTPFKTRIMKGWDRAFRKGLADSLESFASLAQQSLVEFYERMKSRTELQRRSATSLKLLDDQIRAHGQSIRDFNISFRGSVNEQKKEAHRLYSVKGDMMETYIACGHEGGAGCYERMKCMMKSQLATKGAGMYSHSAQKVQDLLLDMTKSMEQDMQDKIAEIVEKLLEEYRTVIQGAAVAETTQFAREHIRNLLRTVDGNFADLVTAATTAGDDDMDVDDDLPLAATRPAARA